MDQSSHRGFDLPSVQERVSSRLSQNSPKNCPHHTTFMNHVNPDPLLPECFALTGFFLHRYDRTPVSLTHLQSLFFPFHNVSRWPLQ